MSTEVTSTLKNGYLLIETSGLIDSLDVHKAHSKKIADHILQSSQSRILLDERKIVYRISLTELYYLINYYSEILSSRAYSIKLASVSKPAYTEGASFWETATSNRGYKIKVFSDYEEAEKWLLAE